jgi:hypothetical protein
MAIYLIADDVIRHAATLAANFGTYTSFRFDLISNFRQQPDGRTI